MGASGHPTRRYFTQAAREAAQAARRAKREMPKDIATVQAFIVRSNHPALPFGWEIRRFGGIILNRSDVAFASQSQALSAGEETLAAMVQA